MGQKQQTFWRFRTPFPPCYIRKNPRSMYARVPHAMAQFILKIEKLSTYITRTAGVRAVSVLDYGSCFLLLVYFHRFFLLLPSLLSICAFNFAYLVSKSNTLTSVFHACPVIDHEFRHNIVKVAVDPRGYCQVHTQTTLPMSRRSSLSITGQMH